MTDARRATEPLRIVLVEDDEPIRRRLAAIITGWPGATLVADCATLAEAVAAIEAQSFDLLVTDLKLPDGNGIEAIRLVGKLRPQAESMVISVLTDERSVLDAIEAGAAGYLLKDADSLDLIDAITDLMAGRSPISSRIARVLVRRLSERGEMAAPVEDRPSLTPREMDILWGVAKGFTYGELAERLGMSRQTVPVHIRNIYRKLQASNRSEAVFEAARLGLIRL
ncbi:response regulator [Devosia sp. Root635]|uniref:response regulator n=1 Tax=Devosia sp. Root635 TaxID=1736575 RepID=UPI0006F86696|nr:response regulator transcription factor [Devosia sp. Root635]KRA47664.1 two-component system response regulator [Devosia sp. Root635]